MMAEEWRPIKTLTEADLPALVALLPALVALGAVPWLTSRNLDWAKEHATHWMPLPDPPRPDPMTVAEWHDMELLPDDHNDLVLIEHKVGGIISCRMTIRAHDKPQGRVRWVSVNALLEAAGLSDG